MLRAAAAASALCSAGAAAALAPHPMRPTTAGAPGLYANYDWPTSPPSKDMEVDHTWITIPDPKNTDGNAIFASSQYFYETYGMNCPNQSDHGASCNSAGYMGSQVMRSGSRERRVFIFSCWDADYGHKVGWKGDGCSRFGGEGVGSHCMLEVDVKEGITYKFTVAQSGKNSSGAFWTGTVVESSTKKKFVVGTLYFPNILGKEGYGGLKVQSDDFLEYFGGGDCDAATATVGISGPYFHGGKVTATQAYPSYGGGDCDHSVVLPCVPGVGCKKPNVLLSGGKGVVRNTTNKQPLW